MVSKRFGAPWTDTPCPSKLAEALTFFDGGRVVVKVVEMPIKCPVAPLEFCFPADWFFHQSGLATRWNSPTVVEFYQTPAGGDTIFT